MWPWSKKESSADAAAPQPAAAPPIAPDQEEELVWVHLQKCKLSEAEREALGTEDGEPREFARGKIVGDGSGKQRRVRMQGTDGLELTVHPDHISPANPDIQDGLDDVSQLSHLNEAALLHHIASRYLDEAIYTRAGPVLVAMNPFTRLPELYSDEQLALYQQSTAAAAAEEDGAAQDAPPPHVYEVAGVVYNNLRLRGASQAVVINGESGSGKTETTKIILRFLTQARAHSAQIGLCPGLARISAWPRPDLLARTSRPPLPPFVSGAALRRRRAVTPAPPQQSSARGLWQLRHAAQRQLEPLRQVRHAALLRLGRAQRRLGPPLPAREVARRHAGAE